MSTALTGQQNCRDSEFRTKRSDWALWQKLHAENVRAREDASQQNCVLRTGKNTSSRREPLHGLQLQGASENTLPTAVRSRKIQCPA